MQNERKRATVLVSRCRGSYS